MKTFRHILLIDDSKMDNFITNRFLTKANISEKITIMDSALEALHYLDELKDNPAAFPDLIFLDIQMPVMDGFGFLNEFRTNPLALTDTCTVIILTSSNDPNDVARALQFPIVKKYQCKPMSLDILNSL